MKITYNEQELRELIVAATGCKPESLKFIVRRDDGAFLDRKDFGVECEFEQDVKMKAGHPRTLEESLAVCRSWVMTDEELAKLQR